MSMQERNGDMRAEDTYIEPHRDDRCLNCRGSRMITVIRQWLSEIMVWLRRNVDYERRRGRICRPPSQEESSQCSNSDYHYTTNYTTNDGTCI